MKSLLWLVCAASAAAADNGWLDRPVEQFRLERAPLAPSLRTLARSCDVPVVVDPDVIGEVSVDVRQGTLRQALMALVVPAGYYFEESEGGVVVRRLKTVLYAIDYPQLTRSGTGSASITLGGTGATAVANAPAQAAPANGSSDATQVSISQENQNTFWSGLEAELRAMLKDGDALVLNKFSGVAQVTAPAARQEVVRAFLELVNRRICSQVEIEARLVEVALSDERKLGIDWELAGASLGKIGVQASAPLDVAGVGGSVFGAATFAAKIGLQQTTAVIQALRQQGEVTTVAQPRLRTLNNQTAMIKVGEDRPFFRLQQSTTFQQSGSSNQTQEQFSVSTITIGTILAVTPQIDAAGVITLDVLPAITRLQAIVTSPDGRQTAPVTEVKQASTIVRLRDGETAVIGGLISEEKGITERSVPGLGAAPLIGKAFRSRGSLRRRTELVIFLTPRLVR
ncbi:MAG: secretin N-terminal domain-containing protein [Candidatus Didemnitutus sp.]|nr:secretin N-terminal domain-containing protein [Candidatus Didemnitutus sp.]